MWYNFKTHNLRVGNLIKEREEEKERKREKDKERERESRWWKIFLVMIASCYIYRAL